jgi:regulatory protein
LTGSPGSPDQDCLSDAQRPVCAAERGADPRKAYAAALRLLTISSLTAGELRERLARRGFEPAAAAAALARVEAAGYLDDRRTAQGWAESAIRVRGLGPLRIRQRLLGRQVSPEVVEEVAAALFPPEEEERLAAAARAKWERHHGPAAEAGERRRLHDHLRRKGFSGAAARAALSRTLENE